MSTMASQITSVSIVCSTVCSNADQRKHQSSASLAFNAGNSPGNGQFPAQRASDAEFFFHLMAWSWLLLDIQFSYARYLYITPTLAREFQDFRVWGKFVFRTLELTDTPINLANRVKVRHALDQSHSVQSRGPERAHQMSRHGSRRGQITDFRDSFETINWLYLLFKCGIKTKTYFEWLLWHWSSLSQLNLEPTRPNGLVGCKVPTDLVKISVKDATHMGFYYNITRTSKRLRTFVRECTSAMVLSCFLYRVAMYNTKWSSKP